jgi:hypothetical protein
MFNLLADLELVMEREKIALFTDGQLGQPIVEVAGVDEITGVVEKKVTLPFMELLGEYRSACLIGRAVFLRLPYYYSYSRIF